MPTIFCLQTISVMSFAFLPIRFQKSPQCWPVRTESCEFYRWVTCCNGLREKRNFFFCFFENIPVDKVYYLYICIYILYIYIAYFPRQSACVLTGLWPTVWGGGSWSTLCHAALWKWWRWENLSRHGICYFGVLPWYDFVDKVSLFQWNIHERNDGKCHDDIVSSK